MSPEISLGFFVKETFALFYVLNILFKTINGSNI